MLLDTVHLFTWSLCDLNTSWIDMLVNLNQCLTIIFIAYKGETTLPGTPNDTFLHI